MEPLTEPSGLRERKKARLREDLIDAALTLFERHGFEATTVQQIADTIPVSRRTFNRYFTSKDDVLVHHEDGILTILLDALAARPAHESALTALRNANNDFLSGDRHAQQRHELASRVWRIQHLINTDPALRGEKLKRSVQREDILTQHLAHRAGLNPVTDPRPAFLAALYLAAIRAATDWWARGTDHSFHALNQQIDHALATIQDGTDIPNLRRQPHPSDIPAMNSQTRPTLIN